ncbi:MULTISPECIES: ribonuclease HIII [Priestia]|uniref:ribonuclease HIII n=1 Tax=Priestia TaxID=2800373 RepID=UPI00203EDE7D|nr:MULTISPECIES: ribonuclease HIII [Priestia]MCM3769993.1 ribonuclease HIII [Priestia aryabhattai]MDY0939396.1 ribonuclease HIII [Priestia megaterium]
MSHAVIKVSADQIAKMKLHYTSYLQPKLPQGSIFAAKTPGCSITAYRSGKVLFQGKEAETEAAKWGGPLDAAKKVPASHLPSNFSSLSVIGSDEVGTGDYFGPMTVVAAYVQKEQLPLLKELGVRDSKELTDAKIIEIAKQLVSFIPYSLLVLHNEKYNAFQEKGMSQGKMKALLHNKALSNVLKKLDPEKPDAILIDQFVEKNTYYKHVVKEKEIIKENVFFSTKGESVHLSVAAASIIARYAFLKQMDLLTEKTGMVIPRGAGAQVDIAAAKIIKKHGVNALNSLAKIHFANTEKALKLAKK